MTLQGSLEYSCAFSRFFLHALSVCFGVALVGLFFIAFPEITHAATWHVSLSGSDTNDGMNPIQPLRNIATAVSRAESGDKIVVFEGTYTESILINKSLTLIGSEGETIISGTGDGITVSNSVSPLSGISISGFVFTTSRGVVISSPFSVTDIDITHNQFHTSSDAFVADGTSAVTGISFMNNIFENTLYLQNISYGVLQDNTFDPRAGLYPFGEEWSAGGPYAVRVLGTASELAHHLTIRNNEWLAGDTYATRYKIALSLRYTSDVVIENNTMTQLYNIGIPIWPITSHVTIRNNTIEADVQAINFSHDGSVDGGTLLIENNIFTGNDYLAYPTLPDYPEAAIAFRGFVGLPTTIQGNVFRNNRAGIVITADADPSLFTIQQNNFFDNSDFHIRNLSSGAVNVLYNWWGAVDGLDDTMTQGNVAATLWYLDSGRTTLSAQTFDVPLYPGWNTVSVPLIPLNTSVGALLSEVADIESVWQYNSQLQQWLVYRPSGDLSLNTLSSMTAGYGYMVNYTGSSTGHIIGYGTLYGAGGTTVPPSLPLEYGWNLIGFYQVNDTISTQAKYALASLEQNVDDSDSYLWTQAWTYDHIALQYRSIGYTDVMNAGEGFWVFVRPIKPRETTVVWYAPGIE